MYLRETFSAKEYLILLNDDEQEKLLKISESLAKDRIDGLREVVERGIIELFAEVKQIEEYERERLTNGKEETGDNG